jgi:hypothetical protein
VMHSVPALPEITFEMCTQPRSSAANLHTIAFGTGPSSFMNQLLTNFRGATKWTPFWSSRYNARNRAARAGNGNRRLVPERKPFRDPYEVFTLGCTSGMRSVSGFRR